MPALVFAQGPSNRRAALATGFLEDVHPREPLADGGVACRDRILRRDMAVEIHRVLAGMVPHDVKDDVVAIELLGQRPDRLFEHPVRDRVTHRFLPAAAVRTASHIVGRKYLRHIAAPGGGPTVPRWLRPLNK